MSTSDRLDALFAPESIAFIGASENNDRFRSIYENLTEYGGTRDIHFVNPNRKSVFGDRCFDTVEDIASPVDLAIIIVPQSVVPVVFEQCCAADVGAAIIVSAGFSEAGEDGQELQRKLSALSEKHDVPFCGPNSYGTLSVQDRTATAQVSTLDIDAGNVAAVLQSGGLLNQILYSGQERGFGFSKVIDSGNEASLSTSQYIDYLIDDEHTDVVIGIIEGFSNPKQFVETAKKATRQNVPLIILKLARSDQGRTIAESHTGSITSPDEITSAVFEQYGVVQVDSLDLLIESAELFSKVTNVGGNGVGILEISGGGCTLFTDLITDSDLELPALDDDTRERIESALPPIGRGSNPVDMAMGWGSERMAQAYPTSIEALTDESEIDTIVSRLSIPQDGDLGAARERIQELQQMDEQYEETFVVISRTSGRVSPQWTEEIKDSSIPFLQSYSKGVETLSAAAWYSLFQRRNSEEHQRVDPLKDVQPIEQQSTEYEAKRQLEASGITTVRESLTTSEAEATDAAERIGYPVCMKIVSPDIAHKTEVGGVQLDIQSPEEVRTAYQSIRDSVDSAAPEADIEGVLIQEMKDGVELLVGSKQTPFGQAIVVGLGGVFTEILDDTQMRIAPFSSDTARKALKDLRSHEVLTGARGATGVNLDELAELISRYSRFVAAHEELTESDLNPIIATEDGVHVVDALFRVSEAN